MQISQVKKVLILTKGMLLKNIKHKLTSENQKEIQVYNKINKEQGNQIKQQIIQHFNNVEVLGMNEWYQEGEIQQQKSLQEFDAVFTLGGDGTLIQASHIIKNNDKLVIGINQNPKISAGFLCCINNEKNQIHKMVQKLLNNELEIIQRKRIEAQIVKDNKVKKNILALNEILLCSQVNYQSVRYGLQQWGNNWGLEEIKSSGLLVYTGTGSSGAASKLNEIRPYDLNRLFKLLNLDKEKISQESFEQVLKLFNQRYFYDPQENKLGIMHQELYTNNKEIVNPDFCKEIDINVHSFDGILLADGYPFILDQNDLLQIKVSSQEKNLKTAVRIL